MILNVKLLMKSNPIKSYFKIFNYKRRTNIYIKDDYLSLKTAFFIKKNKRKIFHNFFKIKIFVKKM
jgi:hypothetical protein